MQHTDDFYAVWQGLIEDDVTPHGKTAQVGRKLWPGPAHAWLRGDETALRLYVVKHPVRRLQIVRGNIQP